MLTFLFGKSLNEAPRYATAIKGFDRISNKVLLLILEITRDFNEWSSFYQLNDVYMITNFRRP